MKFVKPLLISFCLVVTGCATNNDYRWVQDTAKIEKVKRASRSAGTPNMVIWVNPPKKKEYINKDS